MDKEVNIEKTPESYLVDFAERITKILKCATKQYRVKKLQQLYNDLSSLDINTLSLVGQKYLYTLNKDIVEEIKKAGGCWPGCQEQMRCFESAIKNAAKQKDQLALYKLSVKILHLSFEFPLAVNKLIRLNNKIKKKLKMFEK